MTAFELYREGDLEGAVEAALRAVKAAPTDLDARLLLCDLLCFDHQLQRADRQLELLVQQDAALGPALAVYRQLIRAELARQEVFESGRPPELLDDVTEVVALHLRAVLALREGAGEEAAGLLRQADDQRQAVSGECDGTGFEDLRDLNDLTAPFLEVLTSTGKYYWIAWSRIDRLEFKPPKYLRDVLWRQADMVVPGKPDALVYVPVLYARTHGSADPAVRLGRKTEWHDGPGGYVEGVGQRTLLVGEDDRPLLTLGQLSFRPAPQRPAAS